MATQISLSQWVYRMPDNIRKKIQVKKSFIEGFGYSHHLGTLSWNKECPVDYMPAINLFKVPHEADICADVGCGPFCGIFSARQWKTMYAVDPAWHIYESSDLVMCPSENIKFIEDYAQTFKLPEKADIIFSINTLNHSGDIKKSIENIMCNLKIGGLFFLHINHRSPREINSKHPILVSKEIVENILRNYNVIEKMWISDPLCSGKGKPTMIATLKA